MRKHKHVPNERPGLNPGAGRKKKNFNEMELNDFPNREFKEIVINMLTELRKRMDEHREDLKI